MFGLQNDKYAFVAYNNYNMFLLTALKQKLNTYLRNIEAMFIIL